MQAFPIRAGVAVLFVVCVCEVCHASPGDASSAAFDTAGCGDGIAVRLPAGLDGSGAGSVVLDAPGAAACPFSLGDRASNADGAMPARFDAAAVAASFAVADEAATDAARVPVAEASSAQLPDPAPASSPASFAPSASSASSAPQHDAPPPAARAPTRSRPTYDWLPDLVLFALVSVLVISLTVFVAAMVLVVRRHYFTPREVVARAASRGLRRGQFSLEYQPIFHVRSRRCFAVEAQLRWRDSVHGRRGADWFMAQLGSSPVAIELLRFAIETAAAELDVAAVARALPLIVNVPLDCLTNGAHAAQLAELAKSAPNARAILQLPCDALRHAREPVRHLQREGVRVSLSDVRAPADFAAIASSGALEYARLHREIMLLAAAPRAQALKALSAAGHECGVPLVADGVEVVGQYYAAGRARIWLAQGFFLCKALDRDRLFELLERRQTGR